MFFLFNKRILKLLPVGQWVFDKPLKFLIINLLWGGGARLGDTRLLRLPLLITKALPGGEGWVGLQNKLSLSLFAQSGKERIANY